MIPSHLSYRVTLSIPRHPFDTASPLFLLASIEYVFRRRSVALTPPTTVSRCPPTLPSDHLHIPRLSATRKIPPPVGLKYVTGQNKRDRGGNLPLPYRAREVIAGKNSYTAHTKLTSLCVWKRQSLGGNKRDHLISNSLVTPTLTFFTLIYREAVKYDPTTQIFTQIVFLSRSGVTRDTPVGQLQFWR